MLFSSVCQTKNFLARSIQVLKYVDALRVAGGCHFQSFDEVLQRQFVQIVVNPDVLKITEANKQQLQGYCHIPLAVNH